jgi:phospholipase C
MSEDPSEHSRREFLRKAAVLAAGGSVAGILSASIQRAFAIEAPPGSTYLDAEHVVILMQENRSFDHVYGTLRGVRGFNDPRAVSLPNGDRVWFQADKNGDTSVPFHLDIRKSNATWMGELPHGRRDQGDARNGGKHDRWLYAKVPEIKAYADIPLTLGYYTRADLPFHYELADAFTVCDQAFCSVLGPTTPNRLHLWTGTVRSYKSQHSKAHVQNEDTDFGAEVSWKTFPERLEECGISWRNYQNELAVPSGLEGEFDAWLSNFGDNPLEFFTQYGVYFSASHRSYLVGLEKSLTLELAGLERSPLRFTKRQKRRQEAVRGRLDKARGELERWTDENFARLSSNERALHQKAFVTNSGRLDYRELTTLSYKDGPVERTMAVPKGDLLHQFREDVRTGSLPTVSWIIPPERFSDHPSNPWYGALYLSETLDILTQNPDVWKKTIFILCYDENDGYFDHVPPFVPPRADRSDTGKVSSGIDTSSEHVLEEPNKRLDDDGPGKSGRDGPIGLGYRVPLVVASPWSRGGYVCSEVFDHTSVLRLLENLLSRRTGRTIRETNISDWRRTICGDMSSIFRPSNGENAKAPATLKRDEFLAGINQAQFRPIPADFRRLKRKELLRAGEEMLPRQEEGTRPSCALPYELSADGILSGDRKSFKINFRAGNGFFGKRSAGSPFRVYSPASILTQRCGIEAFEIGRTWDYAVAAGDQVEDVWDLADFEDGAYLLRVHGPNGFFREFGGDAGDPPLSLELEPAGPGARSGWGTDLIAMNHDERFAITLSIDDPSYGSGRREVTLGPAGDSRARAVIGIPLESSLGWYDLEVSVSGRPKFTRHLCGHVECGREATSDPLMAVARKSASLRS